MVNIHEETASTPKSSHNRWLAIGITIGMCSIAAVAFLAAYVNSEKVKAISIQYVGDQPEIHDAKIPFRDDHLPDYKLKVQCDNPGFWIFNGTTYTLGPIPNQSAADGLEFAFSGDIPFDKIQQITLIEEDGIDDDPVCSVQLSADKLSAKGYDFKVLTERSLRFGFERMWEGKLGVTIVATMFGLVIAMFHFAIDGGLTILFDSIMTKSK